MARKPVDKQGKHDTREAAWAAMRRLGTFTPPQIRSETLLGRDTVRDYIDGLAAAGYIEETGETVHQRGAAYSRVYRVVRDAAEAPRVRRDGTAVTQGLGREQMWRTMRILGEFSARDLAVTASTEEVLIAYAEAQTYCHYLHRAGYLAATDPGGPGRPARYRFLRTRYTGPQPPQIQRVRQVYDANLREVVWRQGGDSDE